MFTLAPVLTFSPKPSMLARVFLTEGDEKDEPREPVRARACADAIEAVGADRIVMLDLPAPQI